MSAEGGKRGSTEESKQEGDHREICGTTKTQRARRLPSFGHKKIRNSVFSVSWW
jgi:hypothetical protein